MNLTMRPYLGEEDFWRIRSFLRELFLLNGRQELSWHVARFDYWRWHYVENCQTCDPIDQVTFIWETPDREIGAVLHPVNTGEAFLHVHPDFRALDLEDEMLAWAENRLSRRDADGQRRLYVVVDQGDRLRQQLLTKRGYSESGQAIRRWWRDLDEALPDVPLAPGYTIRSMGDVAEFPTRSWASWRAFHPDEPDEAYEGWDWYHNIQSAPLYRRDLDIVAATPAGKITAFCTIWYDDVTRSAVFVLVGTVPEHQRRGLGKAMMFEGLRRLRRMGATRVFVDGYDAAANGLYGAVLRNKELSRSWVKRF
jgi:GNAT superfamily N-acetyltransferase